MAGRESIEGMSSNYTSAIFTSCWLGVWGYVLFRYPKVTAMIWKISWQGQKPLSQLGQKIARWLGAVAMATAVLIAIAVIAKASFN